MSKLLIKDINFKNNICKIYGKISNNDGPFHTIIIDTIKDELTILKNYAGGEFEDHNNYKSIYTKYLESIRMNQNEYTQYLFDNSGLSTYNTLLISKININDFNKFKNK